MVTRAIKKDKTVRKQKKQNSSEIGDPITRIKEIQIHLHIQTTRKRDIVSSVQ